MIQKRKLEGLMFERAAEFYKDENNHLRVRYIKDENGNCHSSSTHFIYAHYVNNDLVYIGESSDTFKRRMNYYCSHKGITNERVRNYFNEEFKKKATADICTFIYIPSRVCYSESLSINPYVALEQELINIYKPFLNRKNVYNRYLNDRFKSKRKRK
tara:strand:- start:943 stop:1413 length:471 start_codon:yes stop_codon:yes gene_type:complete